MLVDLPTGEMQKARNIVLQGLVAGEVNPSTKFWNSILPYIYADVEEKGISLGAYTVRYNIVSWTADQPAKRSLFGFKACNSEGSCFFGMCAGTHYKTMAPARNDVRSGRLTDEDAESGSNGFGSTPPMVVNFVYPYHTIVDLLHNGSEGIFAIIMTEALAKEEKISRRSDIFKNDAILYERLCQTVHLPPEFKANDLSNGSQKINFFRLQFGLAALVNPSLTPEARLVIVSLMLVVNELYTNAPKSDLFFVHLTVAARWALTKSSQRYMTTKAHELLCHLPYVVKQFGNIAPLSTFAFEHFYKYALKGFNAQMTNGFTESVVSRVTLQSAIRREVLKRGKNPGTPEIHDFLSSTPELREADNSWKNRIDRLNQEDSVSSISRFEHYSSLKIPQGHLNSTYSKRKTRNDVFFAENESGIHGCYRFVAACVRGAEVKILAERIRSVGPAEQFGLLQELSANTARPANSYFFNLLNQLKRYNGLVHGKPSGEREVIEIDNVKGIGCSLHHEDAFYYLQVNGAFVHH